MEDTSAVPLETTDRIRYTIPRSYKPAMNVDGLIFASPSLLPSLHGDAALEQVANVACLPGIVRSSIAMPDIHWGYGFCIGGVAATDPDQGGVISPGGVGYDINCGVRLLRTDIPANAAAAYFPQLADLLFARIPCGIGEGGSLHLSNPELRSVLEHGAKYAVSRGFGNNEDLEVTEAAGAIAGADPDAVSERAYERGRNQCGTLGSGNHFLEVQTVEEIFDEQIARDFGLRQGAISVMIHSGSRGLGYQVCEDSLREFQRMPQKYRADLPDRQLICAPVSSEPGQRYLAAMRAAANFAWANRQVMTHLTRDVFSEVFNESPESLGLALVYDVAHNIAKIEQHSVRGESRPLCVHRKGATRAFPAGHLELPPRYRQTGQPILVPGDMGRASYVLAALPGAMEETFGSCCHGAGRRLSRKAAVRAAHDRSILAELAQRGVTARARGRGSLEEEQPEAYKDVSEVVAVVEAAALAKRVARLRPLVVIKG